MHPTLQSCFIMYESKVNIFQFFPFDLDNPVYNYTQYLIRRYHNPYKSQDQKKRQNKHYCTCKKKNT